ncbi:hypothetical protein EYF80_009496 [Liparis tanakae]|uniref:Uncharacterized protein n=1 Tax=Liparis tanakae TaxID=230148 RepID=A0A4Z2IQR7_9TELE|nr:hypothetical protein EYF80_009496 [Liparis tanakae]
MCSKITYEFNFLGKPAEVEDFALQSINCAFGARVSEFVMMPCEDSCNRNSPACLTRLIILDI